MASAMMNAGAFVFDEQETERGEGHGRKRELTRDGMHIKVRAKVITRVEFGVLPQ